MKFILYSLNYSPELTGIGKYNGELCPELVKRGSEVSVFTAPPYYPQWEVAPGYSPYQYQKSDEAGVSVMRCPVYVPKKVTLLKRLLHLGSFAVTSAAALFGQLFSKPDVVFLVQPTLFCAPAALLFAKLTGAKAVMHVQDYEVDALFGLNMVKNRFMLNVAQRAERWLMSKFDAVSTISYSMMEKAQQKGVNKDKLLFFPNWSDIDFVTPHTCGAHLKQEWGFSQDHRVVLYAGNIGEKQGLEIVLQTAAYFQRACTTSEFSGQQKSQYEQLKFVIVGTGAYVDTLKSMAEKLKLDNLFFKPLQPWEKVPEMLALADIHLVVQKKGAADAVLPSKLTNILAAGGHALVTAESEAELGRIASQHRGIYQLVEPENVQAFIDGISTLLMQDLTHYNSVARRYAEQFLSKDMIIDQFCKDVQELCTQRHPISDL